MVRSAYSNDILNFILAYRKENFQVSSYPPRFSLSLANFFLSQLTAIFPASDNTLPFLALPPSPSKAHAEKNNARVGACRAAVEPIVRVYNAGSVSQCESVRMSLLGRGHDFIILFSLSLSLLARV